MPPRRNIAGEVFGKLTVLDEEPEVRKYPNGGCDTFWKVKCSCGSVFTTRLGYLRSGRATRCNKCAHEDIKAKLIGNSKLVVASTKHGYAGHSRKGTRGASKVYAAYRAMHKRCYNKRNSNYKDYGGRGIIVCDRWRGKDGFVNFLADMGEPPPGFGLDRYPDVNGNYEPRNCRWADDNTQQRNKRASVLLELGGVKKHLLEWCEERKLNPSTVRSRLRAGKSIEEALRPAPDHSDEALSS